MRFRANHLLYARSKDWGKRCNPKSYVSMARTKKRLDLAASPALHFSPASSCSTPAAHASANPARAWPVAKCCDGDESGLTGKELVSRFRSLQAGSAR